MWAMQPQRNKFFHVHPKKDNLMFTMFKKPTSQTDRLRVLLAKPKGVTAAEIARYLPTTSPHSKMARLVRTSGWTILKKDNQDGTKQYFGKPPKK
jgi:hypothetical protein